MLRRALNVVGLMSLLLVSVPLSADAACVRKGAETFIQAAHRCVGWMQSPDQMTRVTDFPATDDTKAFAEATVAGRNELFAGGLIVDQLLSTIAQIAVDRARRQALAVVGSRIQDGVCRFPVPASLSETLSPPLLPETCALVQSTDLLGLIGQPRALRSSLAGDVTRIASTEFAARFSDLPAFTDTATAALVIVRRFVAEPNFQPGRDDLQPIAEAFLNAAWAKPQGGGFAPVLTVTKPVAALEVALSAARVYLTASQMRQAEQSAFNRDVEAATAASKTLPPQPPALREAVDVATAIDLQSRLCFLVFPAVPASGTDAAVPSVCPATGLSVLGWTNLAVRSVALIQGDRPNYTDVLRNTTMLIFDTLTAIENERPEDGKTARRRAAIRWTRMVADAAVNSDVPHLISALAEMADDYLATSCGDQCGDRRKTAALLGGIAAYAASYVPIPATATDAEKAKALETQQAARKEALEGVIDAATDRRHRAGDKIWSLGVGAGVTMASFQQIPTTSTELAAAQLNLPLGVAWQRLPSPRWRKGIPIHVMASILDLGNYVTKDRAADQRPDWQAIFAPGVQIGVPVSTSPSNFFVLGATASYAPQFRTTTTGEVRSAWHFGGFVSFYLPLWDFN